MEEITLKKYIVVAFILIVIVLLSLSSFYISKNILYAREIKEIEVIQTMIKGNTVHAYIDNIHDYDINVLLKAYFYNDDKFVYESFEINRKFKSNTRWKVYIYSPERFNNVKWEIIIR
jgi:hypothetical protein